MTSLSESAGSRQANYCLASSSQASTRSSTSSFARTQKPSGTEGHIAARCPVGCLTFGRVAKTTAGWTTCDTSSKEGIMSAKTLTLALMDPPYESANSTTALRIVSSALKKGISVNVFAYEGAVNLPFKDQAPHANPVKGTTVEEEDHPTTRNFVASLLEIGKADPFLTWVNCGLCVDERGAGNSVEGVKRGGPGDFLKMAQ